MENYEEDLRLLFVLMQGTPNIHHAMELAQAEIHRDLEITMEGYLQV